MVVCSYYTAGVISPIAETADRSRVRQYGGRFREWGRRNWGMGGGKAYSLGRRGILVFLAQTRAWKTQPYKEFLENLEFMLGSLKDYYY